MSDISVIDSINKSVDQPTSNSTTSTEERSVAEKFNSQKLLNAYLKNKGGQHNPSTNPNAFIENAPNSEAINNYSNSTSLTNAVIDNNEKQPPFIQKNIKELGSIENVLKGSQENQQVFLADTSSPTTNLYQEANLFPHRDTPIDNANVADQQKRAENTRPAKSLSLMALAIFGVGAIVFGITQFIKQATPNYAAPNQLNIPTNPTIPMVQAPQIMAFQGRLMGVVPDPVTQLYKVKLRFKMFNVETSGSPAWDSGDCQPIVLNEAQIFNVNLGGNNSGGHAYNCGPPLGDIFEKNSSVWIEIIVNDEVLTPRQIVKSVPYSLNAAALQGLHASVAATANTIPALDQFGNLNFATLATAITNTGDLYLLPASKKLYVGTEQLSTDLHVYGNASISGSLATNSITIGNNGLKFQTALGQELWAITPTGNLGIGTNNPSQQLTLGKSGSLAFELGDNHHQWNFANPQLSAIGGGGLENGNYRYRFTCINNSGKESLASDAISINHSAGGQSVISNLPGYSNDCRTLKIYRTPVNSEMYFLAGSKTPDGNNYTDNLADNQLRQNAPLPQAGIYAGKYLSLQFNADGTLTTNHRFKAASHGDNQGFRLPTYTGVPTPKQGQEVGDVVYDSANGSLYIYNGSQFVPLSTKSAHCNGKNCQLIMDPEFAGAILTMNTNSSVEGKAVNGKNYYSIKSSSSATNTIVLNFTIPADFKAWADDAITLDYATFGNDGINSSVAVNIKNQKQPALNLSNGEKYSSSANNWQQDSYNASQLENHQFVAGDTLTLAITTKDNNEEVKIGRLQFNYLTY